MSSSDLETLFNKLHHFLRVAIPLLLKSQQTSTFKEITRINRRHIPVVLLNILHQQRQNIVLLTRFMQQLVVARGDRIKVLSEDA